MGGGGGGEERTRYRRQISDTFFVAMIIMLSVLYMEAPRGGGDFHIKTTGVPVGNFENS